MERRYRNGPPAVSIILGPVSNGMNTGFMIVYEVGKSYACWYDPAATYACGARKGIFIRAFIINTINSSFFIYCIYVGES